MTDTPPPNPPSVPADLSLPDVPVEEAARVLALEPEDLDGYSVDDLADYLDAGFRPRNPRIDASAACQTAIAALLRLRQTASELLTSDVAGEPDPEESWIRGVMENITLESRAGRNIPFRVEDPASSLRITEGVVRSMVREAADHVPGLIVTRVRLQGDVDEIGAPVQVQVEATAVWDARIPAQATTLRAGIDEALARNTDLNVDRIDVTVTDILPPRRLGTELP